LVGKVENVDVPTIKEPESLGRVQDFAMSVNGVQKFFRDRSEGAFPLGIGSKGPF